MQSYGFRLFLVLFAALTHSHDLFAKTAAEAEAANEAELHYAQFNAKPEDKNEEFHVGATRTMHITSVAQFKTALQIITHQGQQLPSDTVIDVIGWTETPNRDDVHIVSANASAQVGLPGDFTIGTPNEADPATQVASYLAASFSVVDLALVEAPAVEPIDTPLAYPSSPSLDFWLTTTAAVVSGVTHYYVFTYMGASPSLTLISSIVIGAMHGGLQHITPAFAKFINKPSKFGTGMLNKLASFMKTQSRRSLITIPIISFVYAMKYFTGLEVWEPTLAQVWETTQGIGIDTVFFLGSTGLAIEALKVHDAGDGQPLSEKSAMVYKWAFLSITLLGRFAQFCEAIEIPAGPIVYGGILTVGAAALVKQKLKFPGLLGRVRKFYMGAAASCAMAFSAATADPLFQTGVEPESPACP